VKFAACVGSAGLPHFTELNVCMLRYVFGGDLPIVIRDDRSTVSSQIELIAAKRDCFYACNEVPLGHFAGDVQAFIDALALGEECNVDIAIKMSQRAMVAHPDLKTHMIRRFQDNPGAAAVMAGRPNPNLIRVGHQQFARFPILTDIVFMRVGAIAPDMIKSAYEDQVRQGKAYIDSFVEVFWDRLRNGPLSDKVILAEELTNHRGGQPPLYLRRYQNRPEEYAGRAQHFGITGTPWDLGERAKMVKGYNPRPRLA